MKRLFKPLMTLCLALLCMFYLPATAQAASKAPAQVKGLKISSGESAATLKWKRISNASGYYVYSVNLENGQLKRIATIKSGKTVSLTVKKLLNDTSYTFCVSAYRKVNSKTYEGKKSSQMKVIPQVTKPSVPKLVISSCGNKQVKLKWNNISKATGYELFQKDTSGKYISLGTTTKTAVTVKKLENGKSYDFKVRAYRKVKGVTRYGNLSAVTTAKPIAVSSELKNIHSMYFNATVRQTIKAKRVSGSGSISVKSGTNVVVTNKTRTDSRVRLKNGTEVYIPSRYLNWVSCIVDSKKDLTKAVKEDYVNYKGYSSKTQYLIWISLYKQHLYVYKGSQCNWKLYKTYKCASGKAQTSTPKGLYTLRRKSPTFRFDEDCFGYYASFFSGNAIHSWVYTNAGNRYNDGQVGTPASHGCVRVEKAQSKFIYDRIPLGTTVVIY